MKPTGREAITTNNMADLNHTSKKALAAELKAAKEELETSDSYRKTQGAVLIRLKKERDDWKQAAEEMKTSRDELYIKLDVDRDLKVSMKDELERRALRLDALNIDQRRMERRLAKANSERDQARAALQALALSNGRLTEHMEAKEAVMSSTNSCTPR